MKRILLILLYSLAAHQTRCAETDTLPGSRMFTLRMQYGFLIAHRPTIRHLQVDHVKGIEAELFIPTNGCNDWQQPFLLPAFSIAYQYLDLGNPTILGAGHALTSRIVFPLTIKRHVRTFISSGFGIGYVEKPFDRFENYKNVAIGSHFNAVVSFSYRAYFNTGKNSRIDAGISFTHFSNGSFRPPNLGINIPTLQIGYSKYFGNPMPCTRYEIPPPEKKPVNKIIASAGIKGLESANGTLMYGVGAIAVSRHYTLSHKSKAGGGIDLFYDRTLPWKLNSLYDEGLKTSTAFRTGIFGGYELTAGKVVMLLQLGIYVVDNYKEDGFMYTKIGVEYAFSKHLLACFHLKTHYAKADYFEYGLGYIL